jgi:hypothetical protein
MSNEWAQPNGPIKDDRHEITESQESMEEIVAKMEQAKTVDRVPERGREEITMPKESYEELGTQMKLEARYENVIQAAIALKRQRLDKTIMPEEKKLQELAETSRRFMDENYRNAVLKIWKATGSPDAAIEQLANGLLARYDTEIKKEKREKK